MFHVFEGDIAMSPAVTLSCMQTQSVSVYNVEVTCMIFDDMFHGFPACPPQCCTLVLCSLVAACTACMCLAQSHAALEIV